MHRTRRATIVVILSWCLALAAALPACTTGTAATGVRRPEAVATTGTDAATLPDVGLIRAGLAKGPAQPAVTGYVEQDTTGALQPQTLRVIGDPVGDVPSPSGDATQAAANYRPADGLLTFELTLANYEDTTGPSWVSEDTFILWGIDVTGDTHADFYLYFWATAGKPSVSLTNDRFEYVCSGLYGLWPTWKVLAAAIPATCLNNPSSFAWRAAFSYDNAATGIRSIDYVPDSTWAGPYPNDAYQAPSPGCTPESNPAAVPAVDGFVSITPARLLDTRNPALTHDCAFRGIGVRPSFSVTPLQVTGRAGVPATASAVVLNVTVVDAQGPGFLTVFPCGTARPNASNLNYNTGSTIPNAVIAKVGVDGRVCLYAQNTTHLLADVNGWFTAAATYASADPQRLLETRAGLQTVDGLSNGVGLRSAGSVTELQITGRGGVPVDATAAALNVTVVEARGAGHVTVYPCGDTPPNASNLNYVAGGTIPNAVIAKIGTNGRICLYVHQATHLIVDVEGWFTAATRYTPALPQRILETRYGLQTSDGRSNGLGLRSGGSITELEVAGRGGVPADATAVVLNVTVVDAKGSGYVTVYPCGTSRPNASNLNYLYGSTIPNAVITKIGTDGRVCLYTHSPTHLIADVNGYFPAP